MKAAIYARYSSESQRKESIADQISACRRYAQTNGLLVSDEQIFTDEAISGSRHDRPGLIALREIARQGGFDILLVDDLSRLARNNLLMLSMIDEFQYAGVRVISVADGLDSESTEATLGIQIRGIFNELQLRDLKQKTLRGQIGQKHRGFSCGERVFGYKTQPVGELRRNKKGVMCPEGYRHEIDPQEMHTVKRVFQMYADGLSLNKIASLLNEERVPKTGPGGVRVTWSVSAVSRMLDNERYIGKWIWNRLGRRKDSRTGRKRNYVKPESEWIIREEKHLRIIPASLWEQVRERRKVSHKVWPKSRHQGFGGDRGSHAKHNPKFLLSGILKCGTCGGSMSKVSGKSGGYLGCLKAKSKACSNTVLVKLDVAQELILESIRNEIFSKVPMHKLLAKLRQALRTHNGGRSSAVAAKQSEIAGLKKRIANLVEFVAAGNHSQAVMKGLQDSESRLATLEAELADLGRAIDEKILPTEAWVTSRTKCLDELLGRRTYRSNALLRELIGDIVMEPVTEPGMKPHYRATAQVSFVKALSLLAKTGKRGSRFDNIALVGTAGIEPATFAV